MHATGINVYFRNLYTAFLSNFLHTISLFTPSINQASLNLLKIEICVQHSSSSESSYTAKFSLCLFISAIALDFNRAWQRYILLIRLRNCPTTCCLSFLCKSVDRYFDYVVRIRNLNPLAKVREILIVPCRTRSQCFLAHSETLSVVHPEFNLLASRIHACVTFCGHPRHV